MDAADADSARAAEAAALWRCGAVVAGQGRQAQRPCGPAPGGRRALFLASCRATGHVTRWLAVCHGAVGRTGRRWLPAWLQRPDTPCARARGCRRRTTAPVLGRDHRALAPCAGQPRPRALSPRRATRMGQALPPRPAPDSAPRPSRAGHRHTRIHACTPPSPAPTTPTTPPPPPPPSLPPPPARPHRLLPLPLLRLLPRPT